MKKYLMTKVVSAEPMTRKEYNNYRGWTIPENENPEDLGYTIVDESNDHISWIEQKVFNNSCLEIGDNKIEKSTLENLISEKIVKTEFIFDKPYTIVDVKLKNGMILHSGTSCVDPKNYDEKIGEEICMRDIEKQMWFGLGFSLSLAQGLNK